MEVWAIDFMYLAAVSDWRNGCMQSTVVRYEVAIYEDLFNEPGAYRRLLHSTHFSGWSGRDVRARSALGAAPRRQSTTRRSSQWRLAAGGQSAGVPNRTRTPPRRM